MGTCFLKILPYQSRTISRVMSRMIICLSLPLPEGLSGQPENDPGRIMVFYSALLRMRFTWHPLLPGDRWALTPPFHPCPGTVWTASAVQSVSGRFISVALSLESPPPDVIRHPAL